MDGKKASVTAIGTAFARAYHAKYDAPKIFDDWKVGELFTVEEQVAFEKNMAESLKYFDAEKAAALDEREALAYVMRNRTAPITLGRSQFTEDSLKIAIERGVKQYVILGAGMDTFAWREDDLMKRVKVFEVDHPMTQEMKVARMKVAGWGKPQNLEFVPMDFNEQNLAEELEKAGYDKSEKTFFSWLGVTYYLPLESVLETLRNVVAIAPRGSEIVFDYFDLEAFDEEKASERMKGMHKFVKMIGEPMMTGFDPGVIAKQLMGSGWRLEENVSPMETQKRFFEGKTEGYSAYEHVYMARAVVL